LMRLVSLTSEFRRRLKREKVTTLTYYVQGDYNWAGKYFANVGMSMEANTHQNENNRPYEGNTKGCRRRWGKKLHTYEYTIITFYTKIR
ncbi:MAG: hypothetical protein K6E54_06630, partial [Bacteroidaceae bacterium]|nr:hypothetical protein [Bacteroidaceae bacterium]